MAIATTWPPRLPITTRRTDLVDEAVRWPTRAADGAAGLRQCGSGSAPRPCRPEAAAASRETGPAIAGCVEWRCGTRIRCTSPDVSGKRRGAAAARVQLARLNEPVGSGLFVLARTCTAAWDDQRRARQRRPRDRGRDRRVTRRRSARRMDCWRSKDTGPATPLTASLMDAHLWTSCALIHDSAGGWE